MTTEYLPNAQEMIKLLESIKPGDRVVYYTGESGWIGQPSLKPLYRWMGGANRSGLYEFTQRKIEDGKYEYIARRRYTANPAEEV